MWGICQHHCTPSPSPPLPRPHPKHMLGKSLCFSTASWSRELNLRLKKKVSPPRENTQHCCHSRFLVRNKELVTAPMPGTDTMEWSRRGSWERVKGCCSLSHDIRSADRNLSSSSSPSSQNRLLPPWFSPSSPHPPKKRSCTSCLQMWRNRKHFKVPPLRPRAYPDANCKCPGHSARKILTPSSPPLPRRLLICNEQAKLKAGGRGVQGSRHLKKAS